MPRPVECGSDARNAIGISVSGYRLRGLLDIAGEMRELGKPERARRALPVAGQGLDGVVAGAPGNNRVRLNAAFLWQFLANHEKGSAAPVLPAARQAVAAAAGLS